MTHCMKHDTTFDYEKGQACRFCHSENEVEIKNLKEKLKIAEESRQVALKEANIK